MKMRRKPACRGVPAQYAACSARLQYADASRIRMAQLHHELGALLKHTSWIAGHFLSQ
jgi:hypothetical protein